MTKVNPPNNGESVAYYGIAGDGRTEMPISSPGATLYVENGTQLKVTKTSGDATVEGVVPDEDVGTMVIFTVGADEVTVK